MNAYEKQSLLIEAIKNIENKIGSYMVEEGTSREDAYVQSQLKKVASWNRDLDELYNTPISEED